MPHTGSKIGSEAPSHYEPSHKYKNKGRHRLPAIDSRNNPPTTGQCRHAYAWQYCYKHRQRLDSQSSLANATIPNDQFNESETSAVSEQGTSSTVSDLINCSKVSHRAQQIMSNIHQNVFKLQMGFPFVKEMHNKHSAWRSYYESFRRLRESVDLPWQKPVEELRERQLLCIQNKTSGSPFVGSRHLQGDLGGLVTVMPTTREIDEINPLSLHTHMPL